MKLSLLSSAILSRYYYFFFLIIICCINGFCIPDTSHIDTSSKFGIYLLKEKISLKELSTIDISNLKTKKLPLISLDDIISYNQHDHSLNLTREAVRKIDGRKKQLVCAVFVVCVNKEPIYAGAFWAYYLSSSFDGVIIPLPLMSGKNLLKIQLGYPAEGCFKGEDLRADPRIVAILRKNGKIKE